MPSEEVQARLLLRALGWDRTLSARGDLRIAVLHAGDAGETNAMRRAFTRAEAGRRLGVRISTVAIPFESTAALLEAFDREGVTAVYVPESLAGASTSIQQVTRARKVPSLAAGRSLVERGVSLGTYLVNGEPEVIVNYRSSLVEGMELSSEFLGTAEVIR